MTTDHEEAEAMIKEIKAKNRAKLDEGWPVMSKTHTGYPRFAYLVEQNFERSLKNQQQGAQFDDLSLLHQRIEALVEFLFPTDTPDRLELELSWQEQISDSYDKMEKAIEDQRRKAKLEVVKKPGGLIIPGR